MFFLGKKQQGLTFITMMVVLGVISFFVLLVLKIGPIYLNHNKIVNALSAVENMQNVESMRKSEVRISLAKRLNMNYVDKININDFVFVKQRNYLKVTLDYERVEKIIGNLSVLVAFSESFEAGDNS
jgi:competence protein ComGC